MLMHREFTDEELGAYLDGGLDEHRRAEFEAELASNGALRAELARVERLNAAIRKAAADIEPAPGRFARIVNDGFDRRERSVIDIGGRTRTLAERWRRPLAASLALAVAASGGYWAGVSLQPREGARLAMIEAGTAVFQAIETTPSGQSRHVRGQTITPVLSFVASDGRACRELEAASGARRSAAIVCREAEGWRVEIMVASAAPEGAGYETVGDDSGAMVEQTYNRLGAGPVLSMEDERARMDNAWAR